MSDDDSSDLSSLSSLSPAPSSDDELEHPAAGKKTSGILKFFPKLSEQPPKEPSPPPRKRSPSPPHEHVFADNSDIAFIVMFRSRFSDAFPKSLIHFGPQELERDVVEPIPGDRVEYFLCAILGLLLNRKQDVKPGHYGRALEDAISSHKNQWPPAWEDKNPLAGGSNFNSMKPTQRLTLLRTLILWAMASSETLKAIINQAYKQNRHEDDLNQPRSVQSWGSDADKRRYFLIEGQDDTNFRVYRESNPASLTRTWWSVAGSIDELRALSTKLETKDGGPKAKRLSQKILAAIPRFEAGEEKRRRREYRQMQKERFKRPEPGFSLYEGRTRGKRIKYTYSDDEDVFHTDSSARRSTRNTGTATPAEAAPVTTMSGRQVRAPASRWPADSAPGSVQGDYEEDYDNGEGLNGRARRSAQARSRRNTSVDSDGASERDFGDDEDEEDEPEDKDDGDAHISEGSEDEDEDDFDEDEAMVADDLGDTDSQSLVVKLRVTPPHLRDTLGSLDQQALNTVSGPLSSAPEKDGSRGGSAQVLDRTATTDTKPDRPMMEHEMKLETGSETPKTTSQPAEPKEEGHREQASHKELKSGTEPPAMMNGTSPYLNGTSKVDRSESVKALQPETVPQNDANGLNVGSDKLVDKLTAPVVAPPASLAFRDSPEITPAVTQADTAHIGKDA